MRAVVVLAAVVASGCGPSPSFVLPTAATLQPSASAPAPAPTPPSLPPNQVRGPIITPATTIVAGQVVAGTVESADPVCFPNWDSSGHCRQYEVTAPVDGLLVVVLNWPAEPPRGIYSPELFLVAPDQSWSFADEVFPNRRGSAQVAKGDTYRLVVLAYGPFPDRYELTADVHR